MILMPTCSRTSTTLKIKAGAFTSSLIFEPKKLKLGSLDLGEVTLQLRQRVINKLYNAVDRLNKVEYNRIWDIQDSSKLTEVTTEAGLSIKPQKYISVTTSGGRITR